MQTSINASIMQAFACKYQSLIRTPLIVPVRASISPSPFAKPSHIPARFFFRKHFRMASSVPLQEDPRINQVLDFWFSLSPVAWFRGSAELDDTIRTRFGEVVHEARSKSLDGSWPATPHGALALVILLDQFSRNIFRGSDESFTSDPHALRIATHAVARGLDRGIRCNGTTDSAEARIRRMFLYVPFQHAEDLLSQVAGTALMEKLVAESPVDVDAKEKEFQQGALFSFRGHRDVILKFGRFPKRNDWLGRETTEEEKKFLEEHPQGF
ncbi:hypothetical protein F5Y15DRAFT_397602 [Xylariaceae sp. FL0016]|nr:hypothetical protein F5Y15DRAFT_397602 [Xylariaceae sp. FL0016]